MSLLRLQYTLITVILFSCGKNKTDNLFSSLPAENTGIHFENRITDTDTLNILDYLYYYNGAGVSAGDINNDGLTDLYFVSNQGSNKLYLNKGNFQFEDITEKAGVKGNGNWKTGATMADVNADGFLDIYLCVVGDYKNLKGENQLFINNHNGTFSERAKEYGLNHVGFGTQSAFLDYDGDGDLDMFLVTHSVHGTENYGDSSIRSKVNEKSGDKLYRNDGTRFTDVTLLAGIYSSVIGYGLGVAVGDLNLDGWEDIYVSNDFHENDYYYVNNGNGTFSEQIRSAFGHTSRFSMGNEIADMNNDGWPDIITSDMLSNDEKVLKSSIGDDPLEIYNFKMSYGYYHQYARNCLQLNLGHGEYFSDIGLMAGIAATDWTWGPLAADFDNDGIKDLFFSNGIVRRLNDLDYIRYYANASLESVLKKSRELDKNVIEKMPPGKMNNFIFKGSDSLIFSDQSLNWGFTKPDFSTGAAYADLDNDGDVDIVTNNINDPAGIYRNNSEELTHNHYLTLQLKGDSLNRFGFGTKVYLKSGEDLQFQQLYATRGFMSSSEPVLHFGLGKNTTVDSLIVIWPDQQKQILTQVKANEILIVQRNTKSDYDVAFLDKPTVTTFRNITDSVDLNWKHSENTFIDFNRQAFIPHMQSAFGPKLAVNDVNSDGLDDFYICGGKNQPGKLFIQTTQRKFISGSMATFQADSACEDVDALFFDADNDKDVDLYVVSGGGEYFKGSPELNDRLYLNDGKGNFSKSNMLVSIPANKSCVAAADIDTDGDIDLFIGARSDENLYGKIPDSYLLVNDGSGNFRIATDQIAPGLRQIGMVSAAVFADMDNDKDFDLVLAGEWLAPTILINNNGKLETRNSELETFKGWWQSLLITDIESDGDMDIVAGNYGLNSKLHASVSDPLVMYVFDYDNNGTNEHILAQGSKGQYYPFLGKDEFEKHIPEIKKQFLKYSDFAGKTVEQIFGNKLKKAMVFKANTLASTMFINDGEGNFSSHLLPPMAQVSPLFSIISGDYNYDGKTDFLCGGNFYGVLPYEGRYDALLPTLCFGEGQGNFNCKVLYGREIQIKGEVRDIKKIKLGGGSTCLILTRNNDAPVFLAYVDSD